MLLYAVPNRPHVEVASMQAHHTNEEKTKTVEDFAMSDTKAMVLITTSSVGSTSLILQAKCWRVHIIEAWIRTIPGLNIPEEMGS